MTNYDGTLTLNGSPLDLGIIPPGGAHFWVIPSASNALDAHGEVGIGAAANRPMATIEGAIALMTANSNDVLHYVPANTSITLAAAVTWSKNYTHFIGYGAPTRTAQRARIFQLSTLTGASPLWTVSATGCIFKNFYIFQGVDDNTSLINFSVTGGRNYFENIHFAGGGHATQAIDGGASLLLDGAEENTFVNCTMGVDTIDAATGMMALRMDGEAHRNVFINPIFRMRAGNSGAGFIEVVDAQGIDRDNTFINPLFINNSSSNDMASCIVAPAGMGEPRVLILKDFATHNVTKVDANDRGIVFGNQDVVTAADLSGAMKEMKE